MKPEAEARLGRALRDVILTFHRSLEDGPWLRRVREAATPVLAAVERKERDYTFTVLDSPAVSAFSTPGGYIYINRGLFRLIGEGDDFDLDALQFVIAHEVAHVERGDALRCLKYPDVRKLKLGTLRTFYFVLIPWGYYPDSLDFEADRWAYDQLRRLGRSQRARLSFLRKLETLNKRNGLENGRGKPLRGPDASLIDNHFRAHPAAWERLNRLKLSAPVPAPKPAR